MLNPTSARSTGNIMYADIDTINIPSGLTSRVQPLVESINKPFKNAVRQEFEEYLKFYTNGKLTASDRRILTEKLVRDALAKIKQ